MIETLLFVVCASGAIAGAFGAALVKNLFHAALLLGLALVGTAGLYLFLEAQWLACVQVVVYVGGILVLILFATLFSADILGAVQRTPWPVRAAGWLGAVLAGGVAWRLAQVVIAEARHLDRTRSAPGVADPLTVPGGASTGDVLLSSWFVPFLAAGLLLTVALVAAVATVQRFRRPATVTSEAARG